MAVDLYSQDSKNLLAVRAINEFLKDLDENYGKMHKPLRFYAKIVSKTRIENKETITKITSNFREFCEENRTHIFEGPLKGLKHPKIGYSDNIYVDMEYILSKASQETTEIIRKHLLMIYAILIDKDEVKEQLKNKENVLSVPDDGSVENNLLKNLIDKVESTSSNPNASPMDAFSSLMQSGIFTDVMSSFQSGKFDIGKLLGSFKMMTSKLDKSDPQLSQALSMLDTLSSTVDGNNAPDISSILSLIGNVPGVPSEKK